MMRRLCLALLLLPLIAAGCTSARKLAPVKGTVTYRNQPVPNALVVFMPESPGMLPATGLTNDGGKYELMTTVPGDGAWIGKHRVTITARGPEKKLPDDPALLPGGNIEPGPPLIPPKYFTPETSGLQVEVPPDGMTANFDLVDM